ncbi:hypothetical protein ACOMHN_017342 [Nucella lapillus]
MVPPFLQPHPDLQSAVGNAPLSSKHPAQLPTTDCLLSIISPMGGQPSDAPALSPPSPLQQGGQSSNAPALSPPSPLPQGGQPIALALSPPSPPPQGGQPSDAPGLSPSSSTLLLCPSDSTLNICHLNSQSAVKTGQCERRRRSRKELQLELVQAIEYDDLTAVHNLIDEGVPLDSSIMFNKTALTYAVERRNVALAQLLVQRGADVNCREPSVNAQQSLHVAVLAGLCSQPLHHGLAPGVPHCDMTQCLLQHGAASGDSHCDMTRCLLRHGAHVNGRDSCRRTPVMLAAHTGHLAAVQLLAAHGAELNAADDMGQTAIHRAVQGRNSAVLTFLLSKGANVNAADAFGWTALYLAILFRYADMVEQLVRSGICVNGTDIFRQSPLCVAVHRLSSQNLQTLLQTSVNLQGRRRRIPTTEIRVLISSAHSTGEVNEVCLRMEFEILHLLVNAGAMVDFCLLGDYFEQLLVDDNAVNAWRVALCHYLVVCDCASDYRRLLSINSKLSLSVMATWVERKQSLQQLCRTAIRSHLRRKQPCDLHSSISQLPIPNSVKNFLNLRDFFDMYPQFLPLFRDVDLSAAQHSTAQRFAISLESEENNFTDH